MVDLCGLQGMEVSRCHQHSTVAYTTRNMHLRCASMPHHMCHVLASVV